MHASSFQLFEKQLKCKELFKILIIEKPPFGKWDIHLTSQPELNACPDSNFKQLDLWSLCTGMKHDIINLTKAWHRSTRFYRKIPVSTPPLWRWASKQMSVVWIMLWIKTRVKTIDWTSLIFFYTIIFVRFYENRIVFIAQWTYLVFFRFFVIVVTMEFACTDVCL